MKWICWLYVKLWPKMYIFWHFAIQVWKWLSPKLHFFHKILYSADSISPKKCWMSYFFAFMHSLCIHDQHIEKGNGSKQYILQHQETKLVIFAKFFSKLLRFCVHQKCCNLGHIKIATTSELLIRLTSSFFYFLS